ncbi:MAG: DMT family transporter [Burkholderiaceae bacterium]
MTAAAAPMPRWMAVTLLLLVATIFAGNHIAARLAFDHGLDVVTAVAVRSGTTAIVVLLFLRLTGVPLAVDRRTAGRAVIVGLLLAVQSYGLYSAVALIPVALALLTFNSFPFLLALVSWGASGVRPAPRILVAMLFALFGLALALDVVGRVSLDGEVGFAARWATIGPGVAHALVAALAFAFVLYLTTRWLADLEGRLRTVLTMGVVSMVAIGAGLIGGGLALPAHPLAWTGLALLTIFYGTAFTMMFAILPRVGAVDNAALLNFEPIASLGLAWAILGQAVAPIQVVGALIVIAAVIAIGLRRG